MGKCAKRWPVLEGNGKVYACVGAILLQGRTTFRVMWSWLILTFESVDEILKDDHSIESYWTVLSCGVICFSLYLEKKFEIFLLALNFFLYYCKWKGSTFFRNSEREVSIRKFQLTEISARVPFSLFMATCFISRIHKWPPRCESVFIANNKFLESFPRSSYRDKDWRYFFTPLEYSASVFSVVSLLMFTYGRSSSVALRPKRSTC